MATKKFKTLLTEAENKQTTEVSALRAKVDSLRENVPVRQSEYEEATEYREDMEAAFLSGNDEHSADDYAKAVANEARADMLAKGSVKAMQSVERRIKNTDSTLANSMVEILNEAYPDIAVVPTFVNNVFDAPSVNERPLILVVQSEGTDFRDSGSMGGNLTIKYYRTALLRQLDHRHIEDTARKMNANIEVSNPTANTQDNEDTLRVTVRSIAPNIPVLPTLKPEASKGWAGGIAAKVVSPTGIAHKAINPDGVFAYGSQKVKAVAVREGLTEEVNGNERTATFNLIVVTRQFGALNGTSLKSLTEQAVNLKGEFVHGLGRVVEVKQVTDSALNVNSKRMLDANFHDLPRNTESMGYEFDNTNVYEVTCVSRVA